MQIASVDTTWLAVGSVATAALALATFVAVMQGRGERNQIITDRELTWRPQLSGEEFASVYVESLNRRPSNLDPLLVNAGGGPAIASRLLWFKERDTEKKWFVSAPLDVPANGGAAHIPSGAEIPESEAMAILKSLGASQTLAGAMFCRDFLERRWGFPVPESDHRAVLRATSWSKPRLTITDNTHTWPRHPGHWAVTETLWKV